MPGLFYRLGSEPGDSLVRSRGILRTRLLDFVSGQTELHLSGASDRYRARIEEAEQQALNEEECIAKVTGLSCY